MYFRPASKYRIAIEEGNQWNLVSNDTITFKNDSIIKIKFYRKQFHLLYIDISEFNKRSALKTLDSIMTVVKENHAQYFVYLSNANNPYIAKQDNDYQDVFNRIPTLNPDPPMARVDHTKIIENIDATAFFDNNTEYVYHFFLSKIAYNNSKNQIIENGFLNEFKSNSETKQKNTQETQIVNIYIPKEVVKAQNENKNYKVINVK